LKAHSSWAFNGRIAYAHLGEGGSVKAYWQQNKSDVEVKLGSALNIGSAVLIVKQGKARITSSNGDVKEGEPEQLLQGLLNSPVPYSTLIHGLRADWFGNSSAAITWQDSLPSRVDAQGWTWQYQEWYSSPAVLPRKIELSQGQTRIRIVIDQWMEVTND
jgi:outer membrane biogenesis lipoprotein LolB